MPRMGGGARHRSPDESIQGGRGEDHGTSNVPMAIKGGSGWANPTAGAKWWIRPGITLGLGIGPAVGLPQSNWPPCHVCNRVCAHESTPCAPHHRLLQRARLLAIGGRGLEFLRTGGLTVDGDGILPCMYAVHTLPPCTALSEPPKSGMVFFLRIRAAPQLKTDSISPDRA